MMAKLISQLKYAIENRIYDVVYLAVAAALIASTISLEKSEMK